MSKSKAKGDLKLLITGVVSLILAIVFAAGETDWNAMWKQVESGFNNVVDDVELD